MDKAVTTYARKPEYATANLGDEVAVLDLESGAYLGFNATASAVWRLLDEPQTLDTLCAHLTDRFTVNEAECRASVAALLSKLGNAGLIQTVNDEVR
jgi:hypothetical protein